MLSISRIICPTDFSEASFEAVNMANGCALNFRSELVLVHVVQPITPLPDAVAAGSFDTRLYEDTLLKGMENKLNDLAAAMISRNVVARTVILSGDPAYRIVELANKENAGLIVIATHGMSGWRHYVHGSVAQKVVQHTERPVLLVRGKPGKK